MGGIPEDEVHRAWGGSSYMASQALVMIWAFIGCAMGSLCNVN